MFRKNMPKRLTAIIMSAVITVMNVAPSVMAEEVADLQTEAEQVTEIHSAEESTIADQASEEHEEAVTGEMTITDVSAEVSAESITNEPQASEVTEETPVREEVIAETDAPVEETTTASIIESEIVAESINQEPTDLTSEDRPEPVSEVTVTEETPLTEESINPTSEVITEAATELSADTSMTVNEPETDAQTEVPATEQATEVQETEPASETAETELTETEQTTEAPVYELVFTGNGYTVYATLPDGVAFANGSFLAATSYAEMSAGLSTDECTAFYNSRLSSMSSAWTLECLGSSELSEAYKEMFLAQYGYVFNVYSDSRVLNVGSLNITIETTDSWARNAIESGAAAALIYTVDGNGDLHRLNVGISLTEDGWTFNANADAGEICIGLIDPSWEYIPPVEETESESLPETATEAEAAAKDMTEAESESASSAYEEEIERESDFSESETEIMSEESSETELITELATENEEEIESEAQIRDFYDSQEVGDVTITASAPAGVFPEGAMLSVQMLSDRDQETVYETLDEIREEDKNVALAYTFDIKVVDVAGVELEPNSEYGNVKVEFSLTNPPIDILDVDVYHTHDEDTEILEAESIKDGVVVYTDEFSVFTVEFTYGDLQYVLEGKETVSLSHILAEVGITLNESNTITSATSSDEELFTVEMVDDEWKVSSLQAFDTEETLTVNIDDATYVITVTDSEENGDVAYITSLVIESVVDGIGPFDDNDDPGNDSSENNGIVRSFDSVKYNIAYADYVYDAEKSYQEAYIGFMYELAYDEQQATFDTDSMNWMATDSDHMWKLEKNVTLSDGSTGQRLTCFKHIEAEGTSTALPGSGTSNLYIKTLALKNGDEIKPIISAWVDGNETDGECEEHGATEVKQIVGDPVTVSAYPRYNVQIKSVPSIYYNQKTYYNLNP